MTSPTDPFSDDALPPGLLADLRAMQRTPAVPAGLERAILADARGRSLRHRRMWVRVGGGIAAAILVVIGLRIAIESMPDGALPTQTAMQELPAASPQAVRPGGTAPGVGSVPVSQGDQPQYPATSPTIVNADLLKRDIDRSGKVDILDAFAVARGIKSGKPSLAWDVQGDGKVDQQDIDDIAAIAVRVKGGVQ